MEIEFTDSESVNKEYNGEKPTLATKTAFFGKVFGRFPFFFDMSQKKGKTLILP